MRRHASHGVGEARLLHRDRSRLKVLVSIRVLDVSMERSRHRKPRDVLLRATRDSSYSKVEQHKTHSSVRTCVDRPLRNCAFVFRQGKR